MYIYILEDEKSMNNVDIFFVYSYIQAVTGCKRQKLRRCTV